MIFNHTEDQSIMEPGLTPTEFCERRAASFIANSSAKVRKARGQFFTPLPVARFMASLVEYRKKILRVLDAGAGTGILSCAVCEAAAKRRIVKKIEIEAYEDLPALARSLKDSLEFAKNWLEDCSIELEYKIIEKDFILDTGQGLCGKIPYDLAIANPPYFKIGKSDPRAEAVERFVYGQPNIYALFMGVAAELLCDKGLMVFITPRSYATGPYFKRFRERFFRMMQPERVHLFGSRKDAFKKDEVLQENIILKARKFGNALMVKISASKGIADLNRFVSHNLPVSQVLHFRDEDVAFRLPVSDFDIEVIDIVEQWDGNLHKYGLEISTGPVVPFRAKELIFSEKEGSIAYAPLIWMQNVQTMKVEWPLFRTRNGKEKPQFIKANKEAIRRKLLIPDQNVVLLRRFSAKEEHRRLTAAPLFKNQLNSQLIGLENHLNYIYMPNGTLSQTKALGLSVLLNSSLLDDYFRISNGNTQVSATEIRIMPLPPLKIIDAIGHKIKQLNNIAAHEEIDSLVWNTIKQG